MAAVCLAGAAGLVLPSPAFGAAGWSVVITPNSTGEDGLGGVAILSAGEAWAVGSAYSVINGTFQQRPLIEHYAGSAWQIVTSPTPAGYPYVELSSVAASGTADVWAVGEYYTASHLREIHPLVEHYDGVSWSIVAVPQVEPRAGFSAVAATSESDVWAVGSTRPATGPAIPLAEHFDGTAWSIATTPALANTVLSGVAAISPGNAWAVGAVGGSAQSGVVLHYDGVGWSRVAVPAPPVANSGWYLSKVTATPSGHLWAVGSYMSTDGLQAHSFVEHFDGSSWALMPLPDRAAGYVIDTVSGVAAASDNDVWVVGSAGTGNQQFVTLTEHFDGTAWSVVPSPNRNTADGLAAIATEGGTRWAVGATAPANSTASQTLVERYS